MNHKNGVNDDEIDLLELLFFLLPRWPFFLIVMVICGAGAVIANHFLVAPSYKSNAEIYVTNSSTLISYQDVQISSALTVDYKEVLQSRKVLRQVIKDQNLDVDYKSLKSHISIDNPTDSHCLVLNVTWSDPEGAVAITNSLLNQGIEQIYRVVGEDAPAIIDYAEKDAVETIKPSMKKFGMMGAMAGFLLLAVYYTIQFLMDSTFKSIEEIEKFIDLPVLSVVPEFNSDKE